MKLLVVPPGDSLEGGETPVEMAGTWWPLRLSGHAEAVEARGVVVAVVEERTMDSPVSVGSLSLWG